MCFFFVAFSDLAKLGVQVLASENEFEEAIALMLESRLVIFFFGCYCILIKMNICCAESCILR